jgi:hypothetical protein
MPGYAASMNHNPNPIPGAGMFGRRGVTSSPGPFDPPERTIVNDWHPDEGISDWHPDDVDYR